MDVNGLFITATVAGDSSSAGNTFVTTANTETHAASITPPAAGYGQALNLQGYPYFLVVLTYVGNMNANVTLTNSLIFLSETNDGDVSKAIVQNGSIDIRGNFSTTVYAVVKPGRYYVYSQFTLLYVLDSSSDATFCTRAQAFGIDSTCAPVAAKFALTSDLLEGTNTTQYQSIIGTTTPSCYTLYLPGPYHYAVLMDATGYYVSGRNDARFELTDNCTIGVDVGLSAGACYDEEAEDMSGATAYAENASEAVYGQGNAAFPPISAHALTLTVVPPGIYKFGAGFYSYLTESMTTPPTAVTAVAQLYAQVIALPIMTPCVTAICRTLPSFVAYFNEIDLDPSMEFVSGPFYLAQAPGHPHTFPLHVYSASVISMDILCTSSEEANNSSVIFTGTVALFNTNGTFAQLDPEVITWAESRTSVLIQTTSCSASALAIVPPGTYYVFGTATSNIGGPGYPLANLSLRVLVSPVNKS